MTRAPEWGPMVLEGPRRPVLQVRRAPAGPLCVWARGTAVPVPPLARGPRGHWEQAATLSPDFGHPGTRSQGLSVPPPWEERPLTGPVLPSKSGRRQEVPTRAGIPGATRACRMAQDPLDASEDQEGDKAWARCGLEPWKGLLCVYWQVTRAGPRGWVA